MKNISKEERIAIINGVKQKHGFTGKAAWFQAQALAISRSNVYYMPRPVSAADLAVMRR